MNLPDTPFVPHEERFTLQLTASIDGPAWIELFNEISEFVSSLRIQQAESNGSDGASKKRKLESTLPEHPKNLKENIKPTSTENGARASNEESLVRVQEISMVVPLRKKFTIDITPSCIQARDPKTCEVVDKTTYRWDRISKFISDNYKVTA